MNQTPFTTSPGYRVEIHGSPGRCAIKSPRGLVAIMEAGNADTREEDAARIVATVNAFPALLAALKGLEWAHSRLLSSESGGVGPEDDEKIIHAGETARAAIALAEGQTPATPARDTLGDTLAALERIAEMTCEDTGRNFDEWGEAACFTDCVRIASECLTSVKGCT